jgi:hypothetical protein
MFIIITFPSLPHTLNNYYENLNVLLVSLAPLVATFSSYKVQLSLKIRNKYCTYMCTMLIDYDY